MKLANAARAGQFFARFVQAEFYRKMGVLGPLNRLSISVTGRCNCRCLTCDIWQSDPEENKELSINDFETLTRSRIVQKAKSIHITGGEPFLRTDIEQIIEVFSKNTNAAICITSNGLLHNRIVSIAKNIKKNRFNVPKISLSLNGNQETHDKTRGIKGSYDKVIETAINLKTLGFYTTFIFTITPENFDQIEWAYKLAGEVDSEINFYPEVNSYRFDKSDNDRTISDEQKKIAIKQLEAVIRNRGYYYFDDSTLYYTHKTFNNEKVCDCYSGLQNAYINWDGRVYPCEGFSSKDYSFGNIKHGSFDDIWISPDAKRVREYIKNDKCQPCFLACDIIPSLRKNILTMFAYTLKRRLISRTCKNKKFG